MKEINDSFDRICKVALWTAEDVQSSLQNLTSRPRKIELPNPLKRRPDNTLRVGAKSGGSRENGNRELSKEGMKIVIVGSQEPDLDNEEYISEKRNSKKWNNNDNFDDEDFDDFGQSLKERKVSRSKSKMDIDIRTKNESKGEVFAESLDTKPNGKRSTPERDDGYEWINVRETPKSPKNKNAFPCTEYGECKFTSHTQFSPETMYPEHPT